MPIPRSQLGPLDGYDHSRGSVAVLNRMNDRLVRWVFGTGFLMLHLMLFGVSLLVALSWDLIVSPDELRIVSPFRYWGIVAITHTILAGGGLLVWRLLQNDQRAFSIPSAPAYRSIAAPRTSPSGWQSAWSRGYGSAQRVNSTARRLASSTTRLPTPWASREIREGWPEQPNIMRSLTNTDPNTTSPDVGEVTWPESAPRSTQLASTGLESDQVVSVDHRGTSASSESWINGFIESRSGDKANRWSWVEAAAASWLSRREPGGQISESSSGDGNISAGMDAITPADERGSAPDA